MRQEIDDIIENFRKRDLNYDIDLVEKEKKFKKWGNDKTDILFVMWCASFCIQFIFSYYPIFYDCYFN